MSALVDLLVETTSPVTVILLIAVLAYIRMVRKDLRKEIKDAEKARGRMRKRLARLEGEIINGNE